jgi:molecular chaperone IbpA
MGTEFRTIHNSALIGFDELFRRIKELEKPQSGFPPYDIIKTTDEEFTIKLAVAGYVKEDISVVLDSGKLIISGTIKLDDYNIDEIVNSTIVNKKPKLEYIYKGIAERDFKRVFTLADTVQVRKVELKNGMLLVMLRNIIPESQKPKIYNIE